MALAVFVAAAVAGGLHAFAEGDLAEADRMSRQAGQALESSRFAEAERLYRRALSIGEAVLGADDPSLVSTLQGLAASLRPLSRYAEAEALTRRAFSILERVGRETSWEGVVVLTATAWILEDQARYTEAEALKLRALSIAGRIDPDGIPVAVTLNNLGEVYRMQGRYADADASYRRALAIVERVSGADHWGVGSILNNLAATAGVRGLHPEAERFLLRSLALLEGRFGPDDLRVATVLDNLAIAVAAQGRVEEARSLGRRSLEIRERGQGPDHQQTARTINNLAMLARQAGRMTEAEQLQRRALAIQEKALGPDHPDVALSLDNLAQLLGESRRLAEAETLHRRALAIRERVLGSEHLDVAYSMNNLGIVLAAQGHDVEAEPLLRRAIALIERVVGAGSPELASAQASLGLVLVHRQQPVPAHEVFERARRMILDLTRRPNLDDEARRFVLGRGRVDLLPYIALLADTARGRAHDAGVESAIGEAFVVAEQLRSSGAAQLALTRMGARAAAGDPTLAELAREQQDRHARLLTLRGQLASEYSRPAAQRNTGRAANLLATIAEQERQGAAAAARLAHAWPRYADLVAPEPIDLAGVARLLGEGEALVAFLTLEDRLLAWAIRRDAAPVFRDIAIGRAELGRRVRGLRASLDQTANPRLASGGLLPVDVEGARALHGLLIESLGDVLGGVRHIFMVPDDVLLPLPFGALLAGADGNAFGRLAALHAAGQPPSDRELADYGSLDWLAKRVTISVLPSATSLGSLRQARGPAVEGVEALIGFGDPVLDGRGGRRGGPMIAGRGSRTPLEHIRRLGRLPGTRAELLAIAAALGADPSTAVFLGPRATKPEVLALNSAGRLGQARVLAFATHGLVGGEIAGVTQPALVLTPPATATDADDGLLALEDVLVLKLPATEWVVLSACNTSQGDASGEGLSGLVRAFFYAGARAALVSHWSVADEATQALMTEIFRAHAADRTASRAVAVQRGILALMTRAQQEGPSYFAHPFAWAPFFLVGEGAASSSLP